MGAIAQRERSEEEYAEVVEFPDNSLGLLLGTAMISCSSSIYGRGGVDAYRAMTMTGMVEFNEQISPS